MIKLYYVRGITRTDTPYFNTLVEQENYFNEKLIGSIDAIYPPHYQNTIQFSNEDLDFNTQCNYISLDFNGKTYYYFIDDMEYLAEDLIRVIITMDTFQTFMFNIDYHNAVIERETIKRWNSDGTINRKYIREKLGTDIMERIEYKNISEEEEADLYYLVGYYVDSDKNYDEDDFGDDFKLTTTLTYNNKYIMDGSTLVIIPMILTPTIINNKSIYFKFDVSYDNFDTNTTSTVSYGGMVNNINSNIKSNPSFYSLCVLRQLPLPIDYSIEETEDKTLYTFRWHQGIKWSGSTPNNSYYLYGITLNGTYNTFVRKKIYEFMYSRPNRVIDKLPNFNYTYIPQLIDENYYSFEFGERMQTTTFPLCKLTRPILTLCRYVDLFTTSRMYWITDKLEYYNEDIYDDKYLTMILNESKEFTLLINDAWRNYLANNVGTLSIGSIMKLIGM